MSTTPLATRADEIAVARLRLNYIFWGTEEPYFTSDVLPFIRDLKRR